MSGYDNVHKALNRAFGPASMHACAICHCTASDFAYDGMCPDEQRDERGRKFTETLWRYMTLCRRCHSRYDAEIRRSGRVDVETLDRMHEEAHEIATPERVTADERERLTANRARFRHMANSRKR